MLQTLFQILLYRLIILLDRAFELCLPFAIILKPTVKIFDLGIGLNHFFGCLGRLLLHGDLLPFLQQRFIFLIKCPFLNPEFFYFIQPVLFALLLNIIFFGTQFKKWNPAVVRATKGSKKKALAYIAAGPNMGGTNIYDPLEAALLDPNVDTIYLLSDGSPGSGKFVATDDILREVKVINAGRRIVINTITFGMKSDFMEKLAKQNNGTYIER